MQVTSALDVPTTTGSDAAPLPTPARDPGRGLVVVILGVAVAICLVAHLALSRSQNINWDEWSYLAKVHTWVRGDSLSRLQTFHVHLFAPLLDDVASLDRELGEVLRLRLVSLGLLAVSALAVVQLARRLLGSVVAGLAAAFAALTFSFVLGHGTAARYDPFVVAAFLVSAVLIVEARHAATSARTSALAVGAGLVLAVGAAVSIKIGLFVPTLAVLLGVGVLGATDPRRRRDALVMAVVVGVVAAVGWRGLVAWHGTTVVSASTVSVVTPTPGLGAQLGSIGDMMFGGVGDGPQRKYLRLSHRYDLGFWALCAAGLVLGGLATLGAAPSGMRTRALRLGVLQALACALPLGALLVYRNTYPYFFVTIVPPASLLIGVVVVVVEQVLSAWPRVRAAAALLLCVPAALTGIRYVTSNHDDQQAGQRAVQQAVHAVFPTPVPYIDRCGMIASYPRVGPFMSSATMAAYRATPDALVWPGLLDTARPRFLINNISSLDLRDPALSSGSRYRWLPGDYRLLQESFIPHWGPLWVAGRRVEVGPEPARFELHIGDRYIVEAPEPVTLDGAAVAPGAVVELAAGPHQASGARPLTLTLRTASAGAPPADPPPGLIFTTFKPRGIPPPWSRGKAARDAVDEEAP